MDDRSNWIANEAVKISMDYGCTIKEAEEIAKYLWELTKIRRKKHVK